MDDPGSSFVAFGVDVIHSELLCALAVELDRDHRVFLAVHVLGLDIDLGAVESSLAFFLRKFDVVLDHYITQVSLCLVPVLLVSEVLLPVLGIPLRKTVCNFVRKSERRKNVVCKLNASRKLFFSLVGTKNDVSLRDRELSYTCKSVHLARILVTEERRGLAHTIRQVAVAALLIHIYVILERTCHGTERHNFLAVLRSLSFLVENEHAVLVMIPVTADLVEVRLSHERCTRTHIAPLVVLEVLHPALQDLDHLRSLGCEERETLTDNIGGKEDLHLAAQTVMVTELDILKVCKISVHVRILRKCRSVDTGEHLVLLVAPPVSARRRDELNCLKLTGRHEVRSCAEVHESALIVERDLSVLGKIADKLNLVGLALLFHELDRLGAGKRKSLELVVFLDDLLNLSLDLVEILAREGRCIKIVVEAFVDRRSDSKLSLGIETLYSLCDNVRSGVAVCSLALLIVECKDAQRTILVNNGSQVNYLAVDLAGAGNSCKALAEVLSDVDHRHR